MSFAGSGHDDNEKRRKEVIEKSCLSIKDSDNVDEVRSLATGNKKFIRRSTLQKDNSWICAPGKRTSKDPITFAYHVSPYPCEMSNNSTNIRVNMKATLDDGDDPALEPQLDSKLPSIELSSNETKKDTQPEIQQNTVFSHTEKTGDYTNEAIEQNATKLGTGELCVGDASESKSGKIIEQYISVTSSHGYNTEHEAEIDTVEFLACDSSESGFGDPDGEENKVFQINKTPGFKADKDDESGSKSRKKRDEVQTGEQRSHPENFSIPNENDSAKSNGEIQGNQIDDNEQLEKGLLQINFDREKRYFSQESGRRHPLNSADNKHQVSAKADEFALEEDTVKCKESSNKRLFQDSVHFIKEESFSKIWTLFVIISAFSLLIGLIIGILVLSQRKIQNRLSSSEPSSHHEPSSYPSITPSFTQIQLHEVSNIPSSYSSRAQNTPTQYALVSPSVAPSDDIFTKQDGKSLPPIKNPTSSLVSETSSPLTQSPILSPSDLPIVTNKLIPSAFPTQIPTLIPSRQTSATVTLSPSPSPTQSPTSSPSNRPSVTVTLSPSGSPTQILTSTPSYQPSLSSTSTPTVTPTKSNASIEFPINDNCETAIGPLAADFSSNFGTIARAETDYVKGCGNIKGYDLGVWYYTIGTGGEMMAHTCSNTNFDSKIAIFEGGCVEPLCMETNDDFCGPDGFQSAVSWSSVYGALYYVLVAGTSDFKDGSFDIVIGARSNDECNTAVGPLTVEDPMPVLGSTIGATKDDISCGYVENESSSVWYLVRGTGGEMKADLCDENKFSVKIRILTGSCSELNCLAVSSFDSRSVTWSSDLDVNYYVVIGGERSGDDGSFSLVLSTTDLPKNNECKDAIGPLRLDGTPIFGSTDSASRDVEAPSCANAVTSSGLWYFVQGNGSTIEASLCASTSYDTRISVYRGSCNSGDGLSGLICIDGNDDFCDKQSLVTWKSEVGVTDYILVHGYLDASGDFSLIVKTH